MCPELDKKWRVAGEQQKEAHAITRRRTLLTLGAFGFAPACIGNPSAYEKPVLGPDGVFSAENLQADLDTYQAFGHHRSGSHADLATADWLSETFTSLGYRVTKRPIEVDNYDEIDSKLQTSDRTYSLMAQPPFLNVGDNRVECRLSYIGPGGPSGPLENRIIVADAPYDRASSFSSPPYRAFADIAITNHARGLVLITNGPSEEAVWLNVYPDRAYPLTALCAPKDAAWLRDAAVHEAPAVLTTPLQKPKRTAYSVIAQMQRGPRQIVISTPFSGWTECAGERGPGIATLKALARWLKTAKPAHSITLIATSGHEQGDLGMRDILTHTAPDPSKTDVWFHLGAGFAARDWYETPIGLVPMKSADPQRYLLASASIQTDAELAFRGLPGLETAHALTPQTAAGELRMIAERGYQTAIGMFGAHRFHHTSMDGVNTVSGALVAPAALAVRRLLSLI